MNKYKLTKLFIEWWTTDGTVEIFLQSTSLTNLLFGNQAFGTKLSFCASMVSLQSSYHNLSRSLSAISILNSHSIVELSSHQLCIK